MYAMANESDILRDTVSRARQFTPNSKQRHGRPSVTKGGSRDGRDVCIEINPPIWNYFDLQ